MNVFIRKVVLRRRSPLDNLRMNESCLKSCHPGRANYASLCNENQNLSCNQVANTDRNVKKDLSYYRKLIQNLSQSAEKPPSFLDSKVQDLLCDNVLNVANDKKRISFSVPEDVYVKVLSRALDAEKKVYSLEKKMDKITSVMMLMLGRNILEELYANHIVGFYLETNENSGDEKLSAKDVELAYTKFFRDSKNELASNIKTVLPNMEPESIAKLIRVIYEKLSTFDDTMLKILKQHFTLGRMIEMYSVVPLLLSSDETKIIDTIHTVLLDFNERKKSDST